MLRIVRIALVAVLPLFAAAAVAGCDDDTQAPASQDLSGAVQDLATTPRDMAQKD